MSRTGDNGPFDGSPLTTSHRSDRSREGHEFAPDKIPRIRCVPIPKPEEIAVYRVLPKVISVLDYSKGFGHSDLVTV